MTSQGEFFYEPLDLKHGMGRIDKIIAFENLRVTKKIFDKSEIKFGLMFGTLLGAVRDGDFINWDEDLDLYLFDEQREKLHDALHLLRSEGLELVRAEGDLYSIMRNGQYIDLYLFRAFGKMRRSLFYEVKSCHLDVMDTIDFRGLKFNVPSDTESLLVEFYGRDWRIPQQDKHALPNTRYQMCLRWLNATSPRAFSMMRRIKRKVLGRTVEE